MAGEKVRFTLSVLALCAVAAYSAQKLVRTHLDINVQAAKTPRYDFERSLTPIRGAVYDSVTDGQGRNSPLVKSTPLWVYRLDPVALTNACLTAEEAAELALPPRADGKDAKRRKKLMRKRRPEAIVRTIAYLLKIDYEETLAKSRNFQNRYQFLAMSDDSRAHGIITTNKSAVAGVVCEDGHTRRYFEGRRFAHVLGGVNAENDGVGGIEQRFNRDLKGIPGTMRGKRDANGNPLYDKHIEMTPPVPGADVYLTVNHVLQYEAESALSEGIEKYGAASGWCVTLDAATGEVLALASKPDFDPAKISRASDEEKINRAIGFTYEPGSVMKTITAACAIDAGFVRPDSLYSTSRNEDGYYKLPGDGSHVWESRMSVKDAIVHSSNIVIGKLGYDFGPLRLYDGMSRFGFGKKTGIELPGEEVGILRDPRKKMWDKATWSRAAIGQGISVTAIQLASAYQAIANDGVRMPPRIVRKVVDSEGRDILDPNTRPPSQGERVISADASCKIREMMLAVASPAGTARRAAVPGYSVAGKTGTAQKVIGGKYAPGLYRATFCGIVPSGVVKRVPSDANPAKPRLVILVSLDFDAKREFHQGGNSAGPIFKRIAQSMLRHLEVEPDRPGELEDYD